MNATVGAGFQQPTYQWQYSSDSGKQWQDIPGATAQQYQRPSNSVIGKYYYRMAVAEAGNMGISNCRVASNMITVVVNELPARTLTSNSPLCAAQTLQLSASGTGSFQWNGPNGFTSNNANPTIANVSVAAAGTYRVAAIDPYGCTNQNSISVSILPPPNVQATNTANICEGGTALLQASGANTFRWYQLPDLTNSIGSGPSLSFTPSGKDTTYQLACTGLAANGCLDTADIVVNVAARPFANAGPDRAVFQGDSTTLSGSVGPFDTYYWTPATYLNNPQTLTPRAAPPSSLSYTLVAESAYGCGTASDVVLVQVYQTVSIPNAFSPNGDGINDTWEIRALESYPSCRITVFDRYGHLILQQTNYNTAWDGTVKGQPAPVGAYYYIIDLGVSNKVLQGSVTIIR
jgi:gliding motility-associated-like protein